MNAVATTLTLANDLLTGMEFGPARVRDLFRLSADVKAHPERFAKSLSGRHVAMIFEKPSLRTRVSFEVGVASLGGAAVFLDQSVSRMGEREPIADAARCLERWVHGIIARTFSQGTIDQLASNSRVPVINALSDKFHPCQAFCDFFTLEERFGNLRGLKFAYIGDGNNMCHSLLTVGARLGVHTRLATPEGFEPDAAVLAEAKRCARETRGKIEVLDSPQEAVEGAQAVYTDVWASMGQESEAEERAEVFAGFQVNDALLSHAAHDAVFLHCLPAHRGLEVTDSVMESERSIVFDQAENRLHVQKAILLTLLS